MTTVLIQWSSTKIALVLQVITVLMVPPMPMSFPVHWEPSAIPQVSRMLLNVARVLGGTTVMNWGKQHIVKSATEVNIKQCVISKVKH